MCEIRGELRAAWHSATAMMNGTDEEDLKNFYRLCKNEGEVAERQHYARCAECQAEGWQGGKHAKVQGLGRESCDGAG
jgi:uncharacterized protein with PIN domain